jgi:hypothetical protein
MEAINQLLKELEPVDFSKNITNLNNLISKAYIPVQIENKVEYADIKKLFNDITTEFSNIYQKITKLDKYKEKRDIILKKKKELLKKIISKLQENNFKVVLLDQFTTENFIMTEANGFKNYTILTKGYINVDDYQKIINDNNINNQDLNKLLNEYKYEIVFLENVKTKKIMKTISKKLDNEIIPNINKHLNKNKIQIKKSLNENEIVIFKTSNSNMLKKALGSQNKGSLKKFIEAFEKLEKYEYSKLLFNDDLTKAVKNYMKEMIEPSLKLIDYQKMMINGNANISPEFKAKFPEVTTNYIDPFQYPYYENNNKEYKAYDFVNLYLKYLVNKLDKDNKSEIDFIINILIRTIYNYTTIKSGTLTSYIKMITSLNTFFQTKNEYFEKVLVNNLKDYLSKIKNIGETDTSEYVIYILNEFYSRNILTFDESTMQTDIEEQPKEYITSIKFDEEVNKITKDLIRIENLRKEKMDLNEQFKETSDQADIEYIQNRIEEIDNQLGPISIKPIKKEKTDEELKLEMINRYTEILDDLQEKLQQNRRNYKLGNILKPEYEKNNEKINKDIDEYETIKKEFNVQKYKKEINKKINHNKIVFDYRPDYEEPENIVLHPSTTAMYQEDAKMKKLMKNKLIKELFKNDQAQKFESRYEKFVVIINNTLPKTLQKVDMKELKSLRSVFEKFIRELSKKLYNHNIMIKTDQNRPFNLVYYPFLKKILVTYFTIHNLMIMSGKNIPIQIKTKKRVFDGLFEQIQNNKFHIFDSKQLKKLIIPLDYIEDIILKSSDNKYKELKEKVKTDKNVCVYIEKLLLNEERNKNMLPKEKFNENISNGLFDILFNIYNEKIGKITYTKELFPEIFIDGEYENINKEIFNKVFDIIRKNKNLDFRYKQNIEKSLILKKKEEDYDKIKLKLYEYIREFTSQLELLRDDKVSLIQLVSLKKQNMTQDLDSYMKYSLNNKYEDILKFALYYQVNENNHPSEEYLRIKDDMIKKYELEMKRYNVSFTDILVNYRRLYEQKERYITSLINIHKKLTSTTRIIKKKDKPNIQEERETFTFLKDKIGINDIQMEKYKKREDFVKIVDTFSDDIKPFNKNLNDEMKKVIFMKKFYDNIMKKRYITSFDLGSMYDSKVNLLTTIFNKDNVNYKLTNCVSIVKPLDFTECPYCPYKNDKIKLIHNHILETHKKDIEKFIEIENVYDPTARTDLRLPKVVKLDKNIKKVEPLKVNNIDCIIDLYNDNRYLYINYIKSSDDRMYNFHKTVMKKVNEIRDDMKIKLHDMKNKNDIKGILKESHKIIKIISKKDFNEYVQDKKNMLNRRMKMISEKTDNTNELINKFIEEGFRQLTTKVTLKEYRDYCQSIKKIISKNILDSLKYNINYDELVDKFNFRQLNEKYVYLNINNADDLKKTIEDIHNPSIVQDRQLRCYSSAKDFLKVLEKFIKGSESGLIKSMFTYEKVKVDANISYQEPYIKSYFTTYLMLKYIVKDQLKEYRKPIDESYENNKSKNFKLPYFFNLIKKQQKNDKGELIGIKSLRSELIENKEYIDKTEWVENFTDEEKKLILQMIKNHRYLALSLQNYFTKKELNEIKYQEKLLKKIIIDFMSMEHYTMKEFMKNYLDIIVYEQQYVLKNKRTKEQEQKFYEEQKFNFVDTLLENEDKREDTEEVKENVEQNKEKVKQISFDFPISDLDEARIVREFNTLEDN